MGLRVQEPYIITPIGENNVEKQMENVMDAGFIDGLSTGMIILQVPRSLKVHGKHLIMGARIVPYSSCDWLC